MVIHGQMSVWEQDLDLQCGWACVSVSEREHGAYAIILFIFTLFIDKYDK